jgi:hypothetical protein
MGRRCRCGGRCASRRYDDMERAVWQRSTESGHGDIARN